MKFSDYEKCEGKIPCPECDGTMARWYSGRQNATAIKTVTRLEDLWKKYGILDPEDPDYAKQNKERVREMREKNQKILEKKLARGEAKVRSKVRVEGKEPGENFTKEDVENLPTKSKGRVSIDKDGNINSSED